jgi:hypothetical protein
LRPLKSPIIPDPKQGFLGTFTPSPDVFFERRTIRQDFQNVALGYLDGHGGDFQCWLRALQPSGIECLCGHVGSYEEIWLLNRRVEEHPRHDGMRGIGNRIE